ncbi:hypothetical protein [Geobacter sp. AOG2]|uniref:hypothetical protein n=1 Tax=Geobacter sp. AOG2 TaxID=1566347 RepID=UPI001CC5EFA7|nr:hypothetical protein [Geobacter sp. AOG2]GFE60531.1 hypothetical protein AOG2_11190 [Geobacter sp. AOG2]
MVKLFFFLVLIMAVTSGCVSDRGVYREQLDSLPFHYSQFDLQMAWDITVTGSETFIAGVAKNVRYAEMDGVEIWVSALDTKGKTLARSVSFVIPRQLKEGEIAPFSVKLPVAAIPGTTLLFTYRYIAHEDAEDSLKWMQSFRTEVSAR